MRYWFSGDVAPLIDTPYTSVLASGATVASESNDRFAPPRPPGRDSARLRWKSWVTVAPSGLEATSTAGAEPTTEMVSAPAVSGRISTLSRKVRSAGNSLPGRLEGRDLSLSNRRGYVPGGSCGMR